MPCNEEGSVSVSASTYRATSWIIGTMLAATIGVNGWALTTLYSLSGRMASVESKIASDGQYHDKSMGDMDRNIQRLEVKIDKLTDLIVNRK